MYKLLEMSHYILVFVFSLLLSPMSFTFSTSQRGTASVPHRIGEKGRTHPHLSKRKELSTPRTATDLVLNLWSSTWLVSTSLRANNPRQSLPLSTLPDKAAHSRPHLSGENMILEIAPVPTPIHHSVLVW